MASRISGTLAAVLMALGAATPGFAQLSEIGPSLGIELAPQATYDYTADAYHAALTYARIASLQQIDPSARGMGSIRTLFVSAGVRSERFETVDFRWRAGLIEMDFVRTPISMGLTLIDYNKVDLLELDVRWVNLRLGPSVFVGTPATNFSLKAVGTGGVTTMKMGTFAYTGLETRDELRARKRSYEIGYLGQAQLLIASRVELNGSLQYRHLLGGLRPERYRFTGTLGVFLGKSLAIYGSYIIEDMRLARSSMDRELFVGQLSLFF